MENNRTLTVRCFESCHYEIKFPDFFLASPKPTCKKMLQWLIRFDGRYDDNVETEHKLGSWFPEAIEDFEDAIHYTKFAWDERSRKYQNEYKSTNRKFFEGCTTKEERDLEEKRRKYHNNQLMQEVKDAKAKHEKAKKDKAKLKDIYTMYGELLKEVYYE